jgi:hypothetical protein
MSTDITVRGVSMDDNEIQERLHAVEVAIRSPALAGTRCAMRDNY